jgi:hypothetical protein
VRVYMCVCMCMYVCMYEYVYSDGGWEIGNEQFADFMLIRAQVLVYVCGGIFL